MVPYFQQNFPKTTEMMNNKARPDDGPGSNGLRGGKNMYSNKVFIGGYVEDVGGPSLFKKGFTTDGNGFRHFIIFRRLKS